MIWDDFNFSKIFAEFYAILKMFKMLKLSTAELQQITQSSSQVFLSKFLSIQLKAVCHVSDWPLQS